MNMASVFSRKIFKTAILFAVLAQVMSMSGWADVQVPDNGEMNAIETETIKISNGSQLILPKGMKTTRIGGQIIVEDPQAFLLRRIEELEKKISDMTDDNAQLNAQVKEGQDQEQLQAFQQMLTDLTARQQKLEEELAQLRASLPTTGYEYIPSEGPVPAENSPTPEAPSP